MRSLVLTIFFFYLQYPLIIEALHITSNHGCLCNKRVNSTSPLSEFACISQAPIEAVHALNVAVNGQKEAEMKTFTDGRCSV